MTMQEKNLEKLLEAIGQIDLTPEERRSGVAWSG